MEQVSANDLQLLQSAQAELVAAQNVVGFAQAHIARVYKLAQGDAIEAGTGRIIRAPQVEGALGLDR